MRARLQVVNPDLVTDYRYPPGPPSAGRVRLRGSTNVRTKIYYKLRVRWCPATTVRSYHTSIHGPVHGPSDGPRPACPCPWRNLVQRFHLALHFGPFFLPIDTEQFQSSMTTERRFFRTFRAGASHRTSLESVARRSRCGARPRRQTSDATRPVQRYRFQSRPSIPSSASASSSSTQSSSSSSSSSPSPSSPSSPYSSSVSSSRTTCSVTVCRASHPA